MEAHRSTATGISTVASRQKASAQHRKPEITLPAIRMDRKKPEAT